MQAGYIDLKNRKTVTLAISINFSHVLSTRVWIWLDLSNLILAYQVSGLARNLANLAGSPLANHMAGPVVGRLAIWLVHLFD